MEKKKKKGWLNIAKIVLFITAVCLLILGVETFQIPLNWDYRQALSALGAILLVFWIWLFIKE